MDAMLAEGRRREDAAARFGRQSTAPDDASATIGTSIAGVSRGISRGGFETFFFNNTRLAPKIPPSPHHQGSSPHASYPRRSYISRVRALPTST